MKASLKVMLCCATLLLWISSCDLFVLGPFLNINRDDEDAGFARLRADQVDEGAVRVGWDWYDLERKLRGAKPVYDQIIIKHNTGSYPASRLGGESFKISDWDPVKNPLWSTVFKDLRDDREHYFALYAHERNGRWMAPMYASVHVEGYDRYTIYPGASTLVSGNFSGGTHTAGAINANQADIYYYDFGDDETVQSATITLEITATPAGDDSIIIYPMRWRWETANFSTMNVGDVDSNPDQFFIDRSIYADIPIETGFTGTLSEDITDVFAKAQYHGTRGILIQTGGQDMTIVTYPPIQVKVVRRY